MSRGWQGRSSGRAVSPPKWIKGFKCLAQAIVLCMKLESCYKREASGRKSRVTAGIHASPAIGWFMGMGYLRTPTKFGSPPLDAFRTLAA